MEVNKSKRPYRSFFRKLTNVLMVGIMVWVFAVIWYAELNKFVSQFDQKGNWLIIFIYMVGVAVSFKLWGGFGIGRHKLVNIISSQLLAVITQNIFGFMIVLLTAGDIYNIHKIVPRILKVAGLQIIFAITVPICLYALYKKLFPPLRMLQIYGDHRNELVAKMGTRRDKYIICEDISVHEPMEKIVRKIDRYDAVLLNDIPSSDRNLIIKYCYDTSKRLYFTPKIPDIIIRGAEVIKYFDSPIYMARNTGFSLDERFIKRLVDILFSSVALIVTSPVLLITAIAIKLDDHGPVIYTQERCTVGGRVFKIHKFRSMIVDAEKDGHAVPAAADDARVTNVGRVIRRLRIDELPQFWDILRGEMSIVGPRPERLEHYNKYSETIPEFSFRLKIKGGLTGYSQVYGKYNTTPLDKLKMDLMYIVDFSLLLDLQIILETVKIIFKKESTEGFSPDQIKEIECEDKMSIDDAVMGNGTIQEE